MIETIVNAILHYCPKDAIAIRTGGDEFSIILEKPDETQSTEMIGRVRKEIAEMAEKMQLPFPLIVSAGCVITDMRCEKDLDDYVRQADEAMYQEKAAKNKPQVRAADCEWRKIRCYVYQDRPCPGAGSI